jgi:hypothetical protein
MSVRTKRARKKKRKPEVDVLKFITYFGIHWSVQLSDPSGGCAGRWMNSYGILQILQILRTPTDSYESYRVL